MALISKIEKDNNITDFDYLLGSDGNNGGKARNFYIADLKEIFSGQVSNIDGGVF